jgi:hypothetical protein
MRPRARLRGVALTTSWPSAVSRWPICISVMVVDDLKARAAAEPSGKAAQAQAEARESFWAFRKNLRYGTMLSGWWVELVAVELQQFYEDLAAGRRPKLALMAPPQHGKSWTAIDFIAWSSGKNPDIKTIFASYSAELGVRANLDLQRIFQSERYKCIFPLTRIGGTGWQCNNELIEFVGRRGSFRNTTVEGQITGMELHLGVIDDPVKGSAEARSRVIRDRTWNWFVDDFCTRFAANGALLVIFCWGASSSVFRASVCCAFLRSASAMITTGEPASLCFRN